MFYQLFNRQSTKTSAPPSRIRVSQHVIAKKVAAGQHSLTPDRLARITASAKQREYRERQKTMPRMEIDSAATEDATKQEHGDTVAPLHSLAQPVAVSNAGTSEDRLGICVEAVNKLNNRFSVPSDGWIHLAPFGSHPHPTGVVQLIDAKSVDAMVANFAARKASDKNFTGALLDFDHFSQSGDKPSEAGGWIENLAKRDDGMWGQVRWTDVGEKAVNGGRYRLVSPVWLKRNCETLDNGQLRPMVLDSVALTNEPNLKGLTPISR